MSVAVEEKHGKIYHPGAAFDDAPLSKATDWASGYIPAFARDFQFDFEQPENNRNFKLMDFACGKGAITKYLGQRLKIGEVVGIDVDEGYVTWAQNQSDLPETVSFTRIEPFQKLDFDDNYFDGIFCAFALTTILEREDIKSVLVELARVLKPGGSCVCLINNPASPGIRFTSIALDSHVPEEPNSDWFIQFYRAHLKKGSQSEYEFSSKPFIDGFERWRSFEWYKETFEESGFCSVRSVTEPYEERYNSYIEEIGIPSELICESEKQHSAALSIVCSLD